MPLARRHVVVPVGRGHRVRAERLLLPLLPAREGRELGVDEAVRVPAGQQRQEVPVARIRVVEVQLAADLPGVVRLGGQPIHVQERLEAPVDLLAGAQRDRVLRAVAVQVVVARGDQEVLDVRDGEVVVVEVGEADRVHHLLDVLVARHRQTGLHRPVVAEHDEAVERGLRHVLRRSHQREHLVGTVGIGIHHPPVAGVVEQLGVHRCVLADHRHRDAARDPFAMDLEGVGVTA